MKPLAEGFSTIIVGQWNPNIFRPNWVKQNLAPEGGDTIEVAFPISDPTLPPRVLIGDIFVFPSNGKLDIRTENLTKDGLSKTVDMAINCLNLLSHTPVSAIGVNVGFTSSAEEAASILQLFTFSDDAKIDSENYKLQGTEIKRTYNLDDCILNLGISYNTVDIKVDFNFHFNVASTDEARQKISDNTAAISYDRASAFLKDTYDLEIEE